MRDSRSAIESCEVIDVCKIGTEECREFIIPGFCLSEFATEQWLQFVPSRLVRTDLFIAGATRSKCVTKQRLKNAALRRVDCSGHRVIGIGIRFGLDVLQEQVNSRQRADNQFG